MSINHFIEKIKLFRLNLKSHLNIGNDIFIVLAICLIGLAGFGLGKISSLEKVREPLLINRVLSNPLIENPSANIPLEATISAKALASSEGSLGLLVASKTGKKYHFPWCSGATQIADKNKIWFSSYEEAQRAGYTKATNCKGLE